MATAPLSAEAKHCIWPRKNRRFTDGRFLSRMRSTCPRCTVSVLCPNCKEAASYGFSPQETVILRLLCDGYGNLDIGETLHISGETVKRHISNICDKSGADTRLMVAMMAVRRAWVRVDIENLVAEELAFAGLS